MTGKNMERTIRHIFYGLLIFSFVYFVLCRLILPSEGLESGMCENFEAQWSWLLADGSEKPIEVPGEYDVAPGESVVITTLLPEAVFEDAALCFRTYHQDVEIWIDGKERISYSTKDTRLFGLASPSIYLMVPLSAEDSGKELTVSLHSQSTYAGVLRQVYYGNEYGIWKELISENVSLLFYAVIMIVFAIVSIVISVVLYMLSKKHFYLEFLGWAVLLIGGWLLCQSPIRQLYFENVTTAAHMVYLMLLLGVFPVCIYVNSVQSFRYNRFYLLVAGAATINWLFSVGTFVANIYEYADVRIFNLGLFGVLMIGIAVTMILDYRKGYMKEYTLIAYGMAGLVVMAALQIVEYLCNDAEMNGVFICLGAVLMIVVAVIDSFQKFLYIQKEQQELQAEVVRKELKIENLTYQAMITLAQTIDAKDSYTKGHSTRVAEYARMIARKIGKDENEQIQIYFMGLLHDIGKIGIRDEIINKPKDLTDEEFRTIKSHPTIGFDILKSMTEIPNIEYAARWHHERYDGKGYPDGIKGEEIPEYVRIIAIADSYDAMASNRSYRKAMPQAVIKEEIEKGKGKQFDPALADIMLQLIEEDVNYDMRQKD